MKELWSYNSEEFSTTISWNLKLSNFNVNFLQINIFSHEFRNQESVFQSFGIVDQSSTGMNEKNQFWL